jgi:hypothetical protein
VKSRRGCSKCLEDWIDEDNPVCVIDVFVDELDLVGEQWCPKTGVVSRCNFSGQARLDAFE